MMMEMSGMGKKPSLQESYIRQYRQSSSITFVTFSLVIAFQGSLLSLE